MVIDSLAAICGTVVSQAHHIWRWRAMKEYVAVNDRGLRIGETHQRSTISDATVDLIREYHEDKGRSYGWIAMRLKIPARTVGKICRYEIRAQWPDRWKPV